MSDTFLYYQASVEFGVGGYRYSNELFKGETIADLYTAINRERIKVIQDIEMQVDNDGDLRAFCPEYANGYPIYDGEEQISCSVENLYRVIAHDLLCPRWDSLWTELTEGLE